MSGKIVKNKKEKNDNRKRLIQGQVLRFINTGLVHVYLLKY